MFAFCANDLVSNTLHSKEAWILYCGMHRIYPNRNFYSRRKWTTRITHHGVQTLHTNIMRRYHWDTITQMQITSTKRPCTLINMKSSTSHIPIACSNIHIQYPQIPLKRRPSHGYQPLQSSHLCSTNSAVRKRSQLTWSTTVIGHGRDFCV